MGERIRAFDWSATPLGPVEAWPPRLKVAVELVLATAYPGSASWGRDMLQIYNDAYIPLLGDRHPKALGRPLAEIWWEYADGLREIADTVFDTGQRFEYADQEFVLRGADGEARSRWFSGVWTPILDDDGAVLGVYSTGVDTTERRQAEAALQEREARQAFLLGLSDALRPLSDAAEIQRTASRMLGVHICSDRLIYCEVEGEGEDAIGLVQGQYIRAGDPFPSRIPYSSFARGFVTEALARGAPVVVRDARTDWRLTDKVRAAWLGVRIVSIAAVSVIKNGREVLAFGAHSFTPRSWTEAEVDLVREVAERTWDAVERARAQAALRESEARQAFLLELSDALRPLSDPAEIQQTASRMLGLHLRADRLMYCEIDGEGEDAIGVIRGQYLREGGPFPERFRYADFTRGFVTESLGRGAPLVVCDARTDPRFSEDVRAAWLQARMLAVVGVSLSKGGREVVDFGPHCFTPRNWTDAEIELVGEVAERTWAAAERARAQAALRESQERLALTFEMLPVGVAMIDLDGNVVMGNDELRRLLPGGFLPPHHAGNPRRWSVWRPDGSLVEPGEYPGARALRGENTADGQELLCAPDGGRGTWMRIAAAPMRDESGQIVGAFVVVVDIDELKRAEVRQATLLAELQHRVRNSLAMVRSVVRRTMGSAESVEDAAELLDGRIDALARTQTLLPRAAGAGIDLEGLIREELLAQGADDARITVKGPVVLLAAKAAEVLTLAMHELATNAAKYGAIGSNGKLDIAWRVVSRPKGPDWLELTWTEMGVAIIAAAARRKGFGTELIEQRVPYELNGQAEMKFRPGGLGVEISFPLIGESIVSAGDLGRAGEH